MVNRYDRRHDEHRPPEEGIEKEIMEILKTGPCAPTELVRTLVEKGYDVNQARDHAWSLIDRGWISPDRNMNLVANQEPTDLV